jgi:uncharacterized membrane protein
MRATARTLAALAAAALALSACLPPAAPDDSRASTHAAWCGTNPPSGYCIVPENDR